MQHRWARLSVIGFIALAARIYAAGLTGVWTQKVVPVSGEANRIAVTVAFGSGFGTPFLQCTNLPPEALVLLPPVSPMGNPLLPVAADLPRSAHSPPAYITLLAGLIRLAHSLKLGLDAPYRAAALFAILISTASVVALAWFAGENLGPAGEWCSGLLLGFWPRLVRLSSALWDTPYTLACLALCLVFLALWKSRTSLKGFALFGFFGGLLTLFNPVAAPVAAITLLVGVLERVPRSQRLSTLGLATAVWMLCVAPWTIRNAVVFGRFIPIRNNFGFEVWLGTLPEFDGTSESLMRRHPMEVRSEQELIAAMGEGDYMKMRTRDGLQEVRAHPGEFLSRTWRRIKLYWLPGTSTPLGATAWYHAPGWLIFFVNLIRLGGAAAGFFAYRDPAVRWVLLIAVLLLPLPYYVTHVCSNYRVFLDPFLWLMFTGFVVTVWRRLPRLRQH